MNQDHNGDQIIRLSKNQIKRNAEALKTLGVQLVDLGKKALNHMPLDNDLRCAIELAQKIRKEGRRRQIQLIGKMLRNRDIKPIQTELNNLKAHYNKRSSLLCRLEGVCDRLMKEGDSAIIATLGAYPKADRQRLRLLVRNAQKNRVQNGSTKAICQIFKYLANLIETSK